MQHKRHKKNKKNISNIKIVGSIMIVIIIAAILFSIQFLQATNIVTNSKPKAVIVDQLSLSLPNATFVDKAVSLLNIANYSVDYIPSKEVTVDFYKTLTAKHYDIIILRTHSTIGTISGEPVFLLFTSEKYNKDRYKYEQITDKVGHVKMDEGSSSYFGIYPDFVKYNMKGEFDDTIIIMMGCGGTFYPEMYEAFFDKGASAYIGWNERVDIKHTDSATITLIKNIFIEKNTLNEATIKTNEDVGLDPTHGSKLLCYSKY